MSIVVTGSLDRWSRNEVEDLINIGAYVTGSNAEVDTAKAMMTEIKGFLTQTVETGTNVTEAQAQLEELVERCKAGHRGTENSQS